MNESKYKEESRSIIMDMDNTVFSKTSEDDVKVNVDHMYCVVTMGDTRTPASLCKGGGYKGLDNTDID